MNKKVMEFSEGSSCCQALQRGSGEGPLSPDRNTSLQ